MLKFKSTEDADCTLDELWDGCTLLSIPWEGIFLRDGFYIAIYLANNKYGLTFVIPDANWADGKLREMIEDILDPIPATDTQENALLRLSFPNKAGLPPEAVVRKFGSVLVRCSVS